MKKNNKLEYETPESSVLAIIDDRILCLSGNHEGTYEEEWED